MKLNGQCHCGAIKFEAEAASNVFGICHCTDCQVMSSTAFSAAVRVRSDHFKVVSGQPKTYTKTAEETGNKSTSVFCGDCGTRVYAWADENPTIIRVRLGVIVQRADLVPGRQIWRRSALPWVDRISDMEAFDRNPS
jgi:hypothetical protein